VAGFEGKKAGISAALPEGPTKSIGVHHSELQTRMSLINRFEHLAKKPHNEKAESVPSDSLYSSLFADPFPCHPLNRQILLKTAALVKPIMVKHKWTVGTLAEVSSAERCGEIGLIPFV
jgi:hypothetical protein